MISAASQQAIAAQPKLQRPVPGMMHAAITANTNANTSRIRPMFCMSLLRSLPPTPLLGALGQAFVVVGDLEHRVARKLVAHLVGERAGLDGTITPVGGIIDDHGHTSGATAVMTPKLCTIPTPPIVPRS